MNKFFKLFSILVVGLALVSCQQPNSDLPNSPDYNGPTYTVKFEVVENEYWMTAISFEIPKKLDESEIIEKAIVYIEENKLSFENKTLKENEEYVLENKDYWLFGSEEEPDLKCEVKYYSDKELTDSIEPGSIVKNENKTIYVKFVYSMYYEGYLKICH